MTDSTALIFSDYSAGHDLPSHPENQSRLDAIEQRLRRDGYLERLPVHRADPVGEVLLAAVHDRSLLDLVQTLAGRGGGFIDGDTYVSSGSHEAGRAACGAAVKAVDLVQSGDHRRAFSMARPPGHHAERRRQLGFCLFNSIAVAAAYALREYQLERIAIVDWDVHHGNGTQDVFYESDEVLFCSVHQWPLFPGTGLENERGSGPGDGLTINRPLPPGCGVREYEAVFNDDFEPAIDSFGPDLLMVSAGFDAHQDDPLAMMSLTDKDFARLAQRVCSWADRLCDGRLVLCLEGGYNLRALSDSVVAVLDVLMSSSQSERDT
jgi:acetoin utilization deacetylase AcuC-like enzyme